MANELKLTVSYDFLGMTNSVGPWKRKETFFTSPGTHFVHGTQAVGTSEEELAQLSDVGTPAMCFLKNLDTVNFVEIGGVTGQYTIKLLAGESAIFRSAQSALYAKADTATVNVEYVMWE